MIQALYTSLQMNGKVGSQGFMESSKALYQLLIGAVLDEKTEKLTIISDGMLNQVPFELLVMKEPIPKKSDLTYLVEKYTIRYAYSNAVLQWQAKQEITKENALLVAPIFANDPQRHLPQSLTSLQAFSDIEHKKLIAEDANIENFKREAPHYGLIHFTTHATSQDPELKQPAIQLIDEPLYLSDLYTFQLPTHLAVLTACQTGVGKQVRGEGIMSLARGFTYAGLPSVVTTLWDVNEQTTHDIINRFYYHLFEGKGKDEALRFAKLDFLSSCEDYQKAPHYWAGIILIGNNQPFAKTIQFGNWIIWLIGICGLLFLVWGYANKRFSN